MRDDAAITFTHDELLAMLIPLARDLKGPAWDEALTDPLRTAWRKVIQAECESAGVPLAVVKELGEAIGKVGTDGVVSSSDSTDLIELERHVDAWLR